MRAVAIIGFFFLLFTSCQDNKKLVYILFDTSEGLATGQDVMLNGVSVGSVLEIDLTEKNEVITTLELSTSVDFPKGSLFEIQSKDLFTKIIHVTLSESKTMIESGDTIVGVFKESLPQLPHTPESPEFIKDIKEMLKN